MQAIDLGDTLTFTEASQNALSCSTENIPCDPSNFVWKAFELFKKKTGIERPIHLHIEKRIPTGGGLGGGSSNVATTLYALNQLAGEPASEKELQLWSAEISSDAPFFFSKGSALCTSKGEIVEECPMPKEEPCYLFCPRYGVSTARVFQALKLKKAHSKNDLEEPAFAVEPRLKEFKEALIKRYGNALMTGSGSSFVSCTKKADEGIPIRFIQRTSGWYSSV